ncbi:prealbumin-like fold domain-containing protein [Marinigracilibium pacificum]|uniref:DUF2606 family protein n=1 Tax=Marinigracilibium pacificum TaxID=2729599 RepID=A0A848J6W5_9BACT|nr:prealbumin-like fold domain-containing protein [Marinigracilibium pacificum]NMM48852.1 DUF2606 family protein [Marinigracilibium pacificum]
MRNLVFLLALLTSSVINFSFVSDSVVENQIFTTSLRLTVLDELGNPVEGAEVKLYKTEDDYNSSENHVKEVYKTDQKGRVVIKDLDMEKYYVNVEKGDLNNYMTGNIVGPLENGKMNRANIIIN